MESKERSPLDPEVHKVVALFADKLTASQMMVGLTEAAERFGLANCTLEDLGKEFMTHQKMLLERGSVGALHVRDIKSRTKKLVAGLGEQTTLTVLVLEGLVGLIFVGALWPMLRRAWLDPLSNVAGAQPEPAVD